MNWVRDKKIEIIALAVVAVVVAVFALASTTSKSGVSSSAPAPSRSTSSGNDKFTQTWPKSYGSTTCNDWLNTMTEKQKFVAAADLLTQARSNDGGSGLPPDSMTATFASGITTVCVVPTMTMPDAAAGLYVTERKRFAP